MTSGGYGNGTKNPLEDQSRKRRKYDYRVETSLLAVAQAFNGITH